MNHNIIDMNYHELTELFEKMIQKEKIPTSIEHRNKRIEYNKKGNVYVSLKILYLYWNARRCWSRCIMPQINRLKTVPHIYSSLADEGCIRDLKVNIYLMRIGVHSLCNKFYGIYNEELLSHFALITMLYDASLDVQACKRYLKDLNDIILDDKQINAQDEYLKVISEATSVIKKHLSNKNYTDFLKYVKILHIIQLLGSNRFSSYNISKENLLRLTYAKGGLSFISIMCLLSCKMTEEQRKAIYEFGAASQLMDDLLDSDLDLKNGIHTIPNQHLMNQKEIQELFYGSVNNLMNKINISSNQPNVLLEIICRVSDKIRYDIE